MVLCLPYNIEQSHDLPHDTAGPEFADHLEGMAIVYNILYLRLEKFFFTYFSPCSHG